MYEFIVFFSYLTEAGLISAREQQHRVAKRQQITCNNDMECYPTGVTFVPTTLIECSGEWTGNSQ